MNHLTERWAGLAEGATYIRKDRVDPVSGEKIPGPTHIQVNSLTLCGRRMKGFGLWVTKEPKGPVCPACLKHQESGTRGAWKP